MLDGMEMAEYCIEVARELGAKYAEARFNEQYGRGIVYRNGEPVGGGYRPLSGVGVRVLADGGMGFASFDRMDRELARTAISRAVKMARNSGRKTPIELGEPVSNTGKWSVDIRQNLRDVSLEQIMEVAKSVNEVGKDLASFTLMMDLSDNIKYLVTTEGTRLEGHLSHVFVMVLMTAKGASGSEQRFIDLTKSGGWEQVSDGQLVSQVSDEAQRLKRAAEHAKALPELLDSPIDMIVGPEVAGIIAHENVGHPSEGDRIMGREGAQAGESFWRDLKLGESRVGSEVVNVSDDPTLPNTGGFYLYDDEGVKARRRRLIKDGIINEPLLNRDFGVRFGLGSNGAARAVSYNREPIIRMANTFFEPGDHSFEELVEDVKLGVYMRSFGEWNIDDRRYQSKYTGTEAYLIRNGELTDIMVKRPVLETTSVGLLSSVDAVSKEFDLAFPGTCGKGDPMQGVPVYAGGGMVRFRSIRLGGVG
ncbi:MAG: TldD/PmbA family protein [Candidatus Thorarchaeota archaeon]